MLPFTAEVFFSVFEQYNRAIWPAQIVAYGLGLGAVALAFRPAAGSDRLIGALLAAAWAWTGVVYHFGYFATINFAAPAFGVLFVLEGVLFAWSAAIRGRLAFRVRAGASGWAAVGLVVVALAVYPLVGWLAGYDVRGAPVVGLAPGPTTIFTLAMLLLSAGRTPLHLVVVPVLWSLVGGAGAWLLALPEGLILPLAGVGALGLVLWTNRRQARP